jgi:PAS domain S-box-containing protein
MIDDPVFFSQAIKWKVLLCFVLISGNLCRAQENIRFDRISVNEGLSQSDIKSMVQDRFGFLWIGTRDGLNRYDGLEFRKYGRKKNDSASLQFNQILDLEVDSAGNIWIASVGGISIYNYRKDSFQNFFPDDAELRDIDVNHILLTGGHTALLSTSRGLVNFDLKQGKYFIDDDLLSFKGMQVLYAAQTREHGLWVGTDQGVFIRSAGQLAWVRLLEDTGIQQIYFDPNGKIYLSASSGLFKYDFEKKKIEPIILPLHPASVSRVLRDKNGKLWVAADKVIVLDKNDVVNYVLAHDRSNNYSLSEDRAKVIFQTHDNVIWIGTSGYGLNKFNPDIAQFSYLSEQTRLPLSASYVSSIYTADDTTLLVGTSRGLDVINLKAKSASHFSDSNDLFQILKIATDRQNNIWVSTSGGFMLYSGSRLIPKNTSMRSVYYFAEWDNTSLILATRTSGIYLFDKQTSRTSVLIPASDLPEEVSCLLVENDRVWVGCKDGLRLYDREGQLTKHFKAGSGAQGSLHSSFIKSIYRDAHGNLWIGTWGGGLSMLHTNDSTFTTYTENNGLPSNVVYGILENRSGTLWLSTNLGISAFDPRDETFRNFDFFDGLQSNEFNTGAYFESSAGRLYFGGINGLSFFDPTEILAHRPVPNILKTSVTVNNKMLSFPDSDSLRNILMIDEVTSGWTENDIGVGFTLIDFKQAQRHTFQYAIKDSTWYDIGNRRSFELIDLPSGSHEIKVRTREPGNHWGKDVVLLKVTIVPPLWQQAWFRIIVALAFFAALFGIFRYRVTRLRRTNALLTKLVHDRTREIKESEEQVQTIIRNAPDAVIAMDEDGRVVKWNAKSEILFGWSEGEVIGRPLSEIIIPHRYRASHVEGLHRFIRTGEGPVLNKTIEIQALHKNEREFDISLSISPTIVKERYLFVGFIRDITEQKAAQGKIVSLNNDLARNIDKLEASNKELDAFSYSISHDLRAPLRAIHGFTKMLSEDYTDKLDNEGKRLIETVLRNTGKMGRLIDDLLAFSKLGKKELRITTVDMTELATAVVNEIKYSSSPIKASIVIHPLLPADGDSGLLTQVFANLISNAIKYSEKKDTPVIEVGCREEGDEAVYFVKDNGAGFDMKYYDKLFGVFQRLHREEEFEGTGVGLALVKRIITRHGGKVWAEAEVGKGATIYFSLNKRAGLNFH